VVSVVVVLVVSAVVVLQPISMYSAGHGARQTPLSSERTTATLSKSDDDLEV